MAEELCPGSNRWGAGEDVLGKGRCAQCGQLIRCNSSGILFGHSAGADRTDKEQG
jgi:hypothetical protein